MSELRQTQRPPQDIDKSRFPTGAQYQCCYTYFNIFSWICKQII